jgi:hypothetical protein
MSARNRSNGPAHRGGNNNRNNQPGRATAPFQQRPLGRLEFPTELPKNLTPRPQPPRPCVEVTLVQTPQVSVAAALVVRHPDGQVTIADIALPREGAGVHSGLLAFFERSLWPGDDYGVIQITGSAAGVWFTPLNLEKVAGKWTASVPSVMDCRSGQIFGTIKQCPRQKMLQALKDFTGVTFLEGQECRTDGYRATPLVDHDEAAHLALQDLPAEALYGVNALQEVGAMGAGWHTENGRAVIHDQELVDAANAISAEIAIAIRAIQLAPAETVAKIADIVPCHISMAEDVLDIEALEPRMVAKATPTFAEARKFRGRSLPSYTEMLTPPPASAYDRIKTVTQAPHFPAEAEMAPATA